MTSSTEKPSDTCCSSPSKMLRQIKKRLPITSWLPKYTKRDGVGDLIAGVTVGLTVVPQSMAYAAIAGLSPEYGLYSSYWGVLIYVLLGSCRQATIGPTAVMGLLTYQTCGQDYPACVVLSAFYSGVFEMLMAILQLGWVVSFISEPVTVGFTAGAAVTILSSQVNSLLGLSGSKGSGFIEYWQAIVKNIGTTRAGDAILGIVSFITLMLLRKLKDVQPKNKALKTTFWLISLSRNVIVIVVTSALSFFWHTPPFKLVGHVKGGFPPVSLPQFELSPRPTWINDTLVEPDEHYNFMDTWSILKTGPLVIALISVLQNVAISKAFGSGQAVDATQEMFALGTSNIVGSFFSVIPTSASFSRSAVNEASGVRSPLGGLYTGILVLLSLNFLTSSFYWIPKSSLAAVIIGAVIFMIDYESVLPMWRISKLDAFSCLVKAYDYLLSNKKGKKGHIRALLVTFICAVVLGMEYGILIGVAISVGALLLKTLRPEIKSDLKSDPITGHDYILVSPANGLNFPSVDHISTSIQKISLKHRECSIIIVDFSKWGSSDYTGANTLVCLEKGMKKNGKTLGFLKCGQTWVDNLKIGGLAQPPLITDEGDISRFLQEKFNFLKGNNYGSVQEQWRNSASLQSIVVVGEGDDCDSGNGSVSRISPVATSIITDSNGGMMEGVGGISMASTGSSSTTDVASLASSTKPIIK